MREIISVLLVTIAVCAWVVFETYSWQECRRIHPAWYCVRTLGK